MQTLNYYVVLEKKEVQSSPSGLIVTSTENEVFYQVVKSKEKDLEGQRVIVDPTKLITFTTNGNKYYAVKEEDIVCIL